MAQEPTVGDLLDDKAFRETVWDKCWAPQSGAPIQLTMEQMAEMNPRLALRHAFKAGLELRGCCRHKPDPGERIDESV